MKNKKINRHNTTALKGILVVLIMLLGVCMVFASTGDNKLSFFESSHFSINQTSGESVVSIVASGTDSAIIKTTVGSESSGMVKVFYRTVNNTAIEGLQYKHIDKSIEIMPGETFTVQPTLLDFTTEEITSYSSELYGKSFYVEVYRVDGGVIDNNAKSVEISAKKGSGNNFTLKNDDFTNRTFYFNLLNLEGTLARDYYNKSGQDGEATINKTSLKDYEVSIDRGDVLLFDIFGSLSRTACKGLSWADFTFHVSDDVGTVYQNNAYCEQGQLNFHGDEWSDRLFSIAGGTVSGGEKSMHNYSTDYVKAKYFMGNPDLSTITVKTHREATGGHCITLASPRMRYCYYDGVAPEIMGYYVTDTDYFYNSTTQQGSDIYISVKFSEPVAIIPTEASEMPKINVAFDTVSGGQVYRDFTYHTGEYTDTLVFKYTMQEKDVTDQVQCSELKLRRFDNLDKRIADLSYNWVIKDSNILRFNGGWEQYSGNPVNFSATGNRIRKLAVNIDCTTPVIKELEHPTDLDTKTYSSLTLKYKLTTVTESSIFEYVFSENEYLTENETFSVGALTKKANSDGSYYYEASATLTGATGKRYLHAKITNSNGIFTYARKENIYDDGGGTIGTQSKGKVIYFDNEAPTVSYAVEKSGYETKHKISVTIRDNMVNEISSGFGDCSLYLAKPENQNKIFDKTNTFTYPLKYRTDSVIYDNPYENFDDSVIGKNDIEKLEDLIVEDGIRIEEQGVKVITDDSGVSIATEMYYDIYVSIHTCANKLLFTDSGVPVISNGEQAVVKEYFAYDYLGKFFLAVSAKDGLGSESRTQKEGSLMLDARLDVLGDNLTIEGTPYGTHNEEGLTFANAYYLEDNAIRIKQSGSNIYVNSITYNNTELIPVDLSNKSIYKKDEHGDYREKTDEAAFYDRYDRYLTTEDNGGVITKILDIANLVDVPNGSGVNFTVKSGYYEIVVKVEGSEAQKSKLSFYLTTDDKDHLNNADLTENIVDIDTLKLINSVYWTTERDYMIRSYNKVKNPEGVGFKNYTEGVYEEVYFVGSGKKLVYASYNAALEDMIARERKDIAIQTITKDNIDTINTREDLKPDKVDFKVGDTVYVYKGLYYKPGDSYHYYKSDTSGAILQALENNAIKTIGKANIGQIHNSFRPINAEGIGFDYEQIVEMENYPIFNNIVNDARFGACPIASAVLLHDYDFYANGVETQVFYRRLASGESTYVNIDIPNNGIRLRDVITTTGFYEIVEMSSFGITRKNVYIDCEAPVTQVSMFQGGSGEALKKDTITNYDQDQNFYLSKLKISGISDSDSNSLLAVYENNGISEVFVAVYQLSVLNDGSAITLSNNKNYVIYVYDRSGNIISTKVSVKNTEITTTQNDLVKTGVYKLGIENRKSSDLIENTLYFNGEKIDELTYDSSRGQYLTSMTLNYSGQYKWEIRDKYGYKFSTSIKYEKTAPTGDFGYYDKATDKFTSIMGTEDIVYDAKLKVWVIRCNSTLQFRYTDDNYKPQFFGVKGLEKGSIENLFVGTKINYCTISDATSSWSLNLTYINDPYVSTTYVCAVDIIDPKVYATAVDSQDRETDITNNGRTNDNKLKLRFEDDETGVVKFAVGLVGEQQNIYVDMAKYTTADGHIEFLLEKEGEYHITAYDLLGNTTDFYVAIDRQLATNITTQGEEKDYSNSENNIEYTDSDVYIEILEDVFIEFGDYLFIIEGREIEILKAVKQEEGVEVPEDYYTKYIAEFTKEEQASDIIEYKEFTLLKTDLRHIKYRLTKDDRFYIVLVAPKTPANNDWNSEETYYYDFVMYDSLGECVTDVSGFTGATEEGLDFEETDPKLQVGGKQVYVRYTTMNTLRYKIELSNKKVTSGFINEQGEDLKDIKETMGRYNCNFTLNIDVIKNLIDSGEVLFVGYKYHKNTVLDKDLEYIELYPNGSIYKPFIDEGEYEIIFVSKYKTEFKQVIRLGKAINAITIANYQDGTSREIQMGEYITQNKQYVYANKSIEISLSAKYNEISILKDNVDITEDIKIDYVNDLPVFTLTKEGSYYINVVDYINNTLEIEAGIVKKNVSYNVYEELNNWETDALRYDEYYNCNKLGFTGKDDDIYFISYEFYSFAELSQYQVQLDAYNLALTAYNEAYAKWVEAGKVDVEPAKPKEPTNPKDKSNSIVVLDKFVRGGANFIESQKIGEDGNGEYYITFMDKYGNSYVEKLVINNSSNIQFSRRMQDQLEYTIVEKSTINTIGLYSNYSVMIMVLDGEKYRITIDNDVLEGVGAFDKKLFSDNLEVLVYLVEVVDQYGNKFSFNAKIDRKRPMLTFEDETMFELIGDVYTTKGAPIINCDKTEVEITYTLGDNLEEILTYEPGTTLTEDGYYVMTASDYAGNSSVKTFAIDTKVNYSVRASGLNTTKDLPQGIIITEGSVIFSGNGEKIFITKVFRNGEEVAHDSSSFVNDGEYSVTVTDEIGNQDNFKFFIYKYALREFVYKVPTGYTFVSTSIIEADREIAARYLISIDEKGIETVTAPANATIKMVISLIGSQSLEDRYVVSITTDVEKPYLELKQATNGQSTTKDVSFSPVSEDCTMYVYKNGSLLYTTELEKGEAPKYVIVDEGEYKVTLVDRSGNIDEYTFTRKYTMNTWAIVAIVCGGILVVLGIVIFLRMRNKIKVS